MIKKRSLLAKVSAAFLMIAAGLGTMLSAQEKKESAKPLLKIPLRVMNLPDPRGTSPGIQIELALLREFKKMHPDIELSAFSGIQLQNVGSESRLMLAIAGGAAPDIIEVNFRMSDTYIQQNFLYPLDEFIAKSDEYKSVKNFLDKTAPAIQPVLWLPISKRANTSGCWGTIPPSAC